MGKGFVHSRSYARYAPKRTSYRRTVKHPYGNRYGNDAFVKCETIEPLATGGVGSEENVFSTMRVNSPAAISPGNTYLGLNAEFQQF